MQENDFLQTPKRKRVFTRKKTWKTPEKKIMLHMCKTHIANKTLPSFVYLNSIRNQYPIFRTRTVEQMKTWVSNLNKSKKKS